MCDTVCLSRNVIFDFKKFSLTLTSIFLRSGWLAKTLVQAPKRSVWQSAIARDAARARARAAHTRAAERLYDPCYCSLGFKFLPEEPVSSEEKFLLTNVKGSNGAMRDAGELRELMLSRALRLGSLQLLKT